MPSILPEQVEDGFVGSPILYKLADVVLPYHDVHARAVWKPERADDLGGALNNASPLIVDNVLPADSLRLYWVSP
jgi:hypothetical protein